MVAGHPSPPFHAAQREAFAELLSEPGQDAVAFRVTVRGHCMTPALRDGQVVRVVRRSWALPGDVVAFRRGLEDPGLAVHRFLGVRLGRRGVALVTQADNEPRPDPAFGPSRLVGVAQVPVSVPQRARAVGRWARALLHQAQRAVEARTVARPGRSPLPVSPSTPT